MMNDSMAQGQQSEVVVVFADFERSARVLYPLEKGEAGDDNGRGAVNWGITEYFLSLTGDSRPPSSLTWEDAKALYHKYFWLPWKLNKIHADKQPIADFLLTCFVNTSPQHVALAAQKALNGCGFMIKQDGMFGPITLHAINTCNTDIFLWNLYHFMIGWYERLADTNKYVLNVKTGEHEMVKANARFLKGWIKRMKYLHKYSTLDDNSIPSHVPEMDDYTPTDPRK